MSDRLVELRARDDDRLEKVLHLVDDEQPALASVRVERADEGVWTHGDARGCWTLDTFARAASVVVRTLLVASATLAELPLHALPTRNEWSSNVRELTDRCTRRVLERQRTEEANGRSLEVDEASDALDGERMFVDGHRGLRSGRRAGSERGGIGVRLRRALRHHAKRRLRLAEAALGLHERQPWRCVVDHPHQRRGDLGKGRRRRVHRRVHRRGRDRIGRR